MKITILYYSRTGTTAKVAELVEKGVQLAGNINTKIMSLEDMDLDFLRSSNAIIFGSSTYSANFAWPLKRWFDEEARNCNLSGKLAANFVTGKYIGGGEDSALSSMATHELVRAMLVYSGGGTLTHVGLVVIDINDDFQRNRSIEFGKRIGKKAIELFGLS